MAWPWRQLFGKAALRAPQYRGLELNEEQRSAVEETERKASPGKLTHGGEIEIHTG